MATYTELFDLATNSALRNRIAVAVMVATDVVRTEDPGTANHSARMEWASRALRDPLGEADRALRAALAQNKSLTTAQITSANDAALQTAVNNVIDQLALAN